MSSSTEINDVFEECLMTVVKTDVKHCWTKFSQIFILYIYIYAFSRRFYPKRLTGYNFFFFFYVCFLGTNTDINCQIL